MKARAEVTGAVLAALLVAGCASASRGAAGETGGETVQQFVQVVNQTDGPVTVTARVGAGAEQDLGFFGPAERRTVRIPTGASTDDKIFLWARNRQTGEQATTELTVTPGQILTWIIQF